MKTIEFYRGNQKTVIAASDIMSDKGAVIDSLSQKFGTERVERAREFPDLQARIEILGEDFQGSRTVERVTLGTNEIDFDAAVELMDDDIREELYDRRFDDAQEFLNAYVTAHAKKFGETFTV